MLKDLLSVAGTVALVLLGAFVTPAQQREVLSDNFFVQYQGKGRDAHVDIFVRAADGKAEYLGSASTRNSESGFAGLGETMSVLAVSKDGRSLVFRHYPEFAKGRSTQEGGIYHYEYGKGAHLLHKSEELIEKWTVWRKPLPKDVLVFKVWLEKGKYLMGPEMALSADGKEFPLALLGGTALHQAAYDGRTAEIDALLEQGEPIDAQTHWGDTPLSVALIRLHDEAAVRLVDRGANLELGPHPALHIAAHTTSFSALEAMARRGANMNVLDGRKNTPLNLAGLGYRDFVFGGDNQNDRRLSWWEHVPQIVSWLLKHGADPNNRNIEGATALHRVATSAENTYELEAARALLEHGADANLADNQGNTPLHLLAADTRTCDAGEGAFAGKPAEWKQSGRYQLLALLVASMRDINVRNANGQTPLELALLNRNELSPQFLIEHGADANLRTTETRSMPSLAGLTLGQLLEKTRKQWKALCKR
jgi:ankyrin repeat protein